MMYPSHVPATLLVLVTSCLTSYINADAIKVQLSKRAAPSPKIMFDDGIDSVDRLDFGDSISNSNLGGYTARPEGVFVKTAKDPGDNGAYFTPEGAGSSKFVSKRFNEFVGKRSPNPVEYSSEVVVAPPVEERRESMDVADLINQELMNRKSETGEGDGGEFAETELGEFTDRGEDGGDKRQYEFVGKRPYDFVGKKRYDFLGKRYDFLGKRSSDDTLGKRYDFLGKRYDFLGKRLPEDALGKRYDFLGKRYDFLGKRYDFLGKRSPLSKKSYAFLGKRFNQFVGKRSPYEFVGKRSDSESESVSDAKQSQDMLAQFHPPSPAKRYTEFVGKRSEEQGVAALTDTARLAVLLQNNGLRKRLSRMLLGSDGLDQQFPEFIGK